MSEQTVYPARRSFAAGQVGNFVYGRTDTSGYQEGCLELTNMISDPRGPAWRRPGMQFKFDSGTSTGSPAQVLIYVYGKTPYVVVIGETDIEVFDTDGGSVFSTAHPWSAAVVEAVRWVEFPDEERMWFVHESEPPQALTFDGTTWEFEPIVFISPPAEWGADNWPSVVAVFQGRAWLGSTPKQPTTVWGSRVNAGTKTSAFFEATGTGTDKYRYNNAVVFDTTTYPITQEHYNLEVYVDGVLQDGDPGGADAYDVIPYPTGGQVVNPRTYYVYAEVEFNGTPPAEGAIIELRTVNDNYGTDPYRDFTQLDGALADYAVEIILSARGRIEWIESSKNLLVGTENGEHIITSSSGLISPSDIETEQQSAYGSLSQDALKLGYEVLFITPDGLKVRSLRFEWTAEGWLSSDSTFVAREITFPGIKQLAFLQNPNNVLWCLRTDGTLVGATFDPQGLAAGSGWHQHNTDGSVVSITSAEEEGVSTLYLLVDRGGPNYTVETLTTINTEEVFMDSYVEETGSGINTVTGLDHLIGQEVLGVVDGKVQAAVVVNGSGEAVFPTSGDVLAAGLEYTARMRTLPLDTPVPGGVDSIIPWVKRYSQVFIGLINSARPLVNGVRIPEREPSTPYNTAQPFAEFENIEVTNVGYDKNAIITIEENLPTPLTVTGVFGKAKVSLL